MNRPTLLCAMIATLLAAPACKSRNSVTGPPGNQGSGTYYMRARIDGVTWTSTLGSEATYVPTTLPGLYSFTGIQAGGYTLSITLYNIPGPGTYPLGVGPTGVGGTAVLSNTSGGWATVLSGADGSVTLTALTATRMTGTFNVVVSALTGTATGTRTVTNGEFNLQLRATGTIGPLPANAGSKVTATIAGTAWNAATISGNLTSTFGIFALAASTNTRGLSISLGEVTAPGTYALAGGSPTRQIGVTNVNNPLGNSWSSLGPGSSGSVTITSITTARITGTFSATLGPAPGTSTTGTLSVTSGTFDIGRITATIAAGATAQR